MYAERPSRIAGAARWESVRASGTSILPDGCMDLVWIGGRVVVAGPDTQAWHSPSRSDRVSGVRFAPGTLPSVLGVPASALRDARVPLDEVLPGDNTAALVDELRVGADPVRTLESFAGARIRPDPRTSMIVEGLRRGLGVGEVADQAGLGDRQLHRLSLRAFGYGPKTLARILRLQRALSLQASGETAAGIAAEAGYADQSHLIRDARDLASVPFGELVSR